MAAGVADQALVQVSYAIGVVEPTGVFIDTYGSSKVDLTDGEIANKVSELFDLRPGMIEKSLKLRAPIYGETAAYGHMGRKPQTIKKTFFNANGNGVNTKEVEVELFAWEKLDRVNDIKNAFGLN